MSDYASDNTFSGWGERDDRALIDQAEHDQADAKHEALLDRRDENLPVSRLKVGTDARGPGSAGSSIVGNGASDLRRLGPTTPPEAESSSVPGPASALDPHPAIGLCELCKEDAALPGDLFCGPCAAEIVGDAA
jgi:hypothetical protein